MVRVSERTLCSRYFGGGVSVSISHIHTELISEGSSSFGDWNAWICLVGDFLGIRSHGMKITMKNPPFWRIDFLFFSNDLKKI